MQDKLSVVMIDDSTLDLLLYQEFFKYYKIPHESQTFFYAGDALEFLASNEPINWPDLILLDIQMPEMNGFDFLNEYVKFPEAQRRKTKVIMVSSSIDSGDIDKAKMHPEVVDILQKPISMSRLMKLLGYTSF